MTRPRLRAAGYTRRRAATWLALAFALPLCAHAMFPGAAPSLPNTAATDAAVAEAPRAGDGSGLRAKRDAAYYRASIGHCRQLHGRVRTLCFDEAAKLYAR